MNRSTNRVSTSDQPSILGGSFTLPVTVQIALAWLLHHNANILLIPGTSPVDHLRESL